MEVGSHRLHVDAWPNTSIKIRFIHWELEHLTLLQFVNYEGFVRWQEDEEARYSFNLSFFSEKRRSFTGLIVRERTSVHRQRQITADTFEKNRCGSWGYCALRKRYLGYFAA